MVALIIIGFVVLCFLTCWACCIVASWADEQAERDYK